MKFEVYRDRHGEWRWRYVASNGRIIAVSSEGYKRRRGALHAVSLLRRFASVSGVVDKG